MTYFEDLSEYVYEKSLRRDGQVNIGWIEEEIPFYNPNTGKEFLDKLWEFCKYAVGEARGGYLCNICANYSAIISEHNGERLALGGAEIRVFGNKKKIYCAPNLIFHYIKYHQYGPPKEFIDSVMKCPAPDSNEYASMMKKINLKFNKLLPAPSEIKIIKL